VAAVAEPALAVLPGTDGGDGCYRAQWGGARERLAAVCSASTRDAYTALLGCRWQYEGPLSNPVADAVDYLRTAVVYLVGPGEVAAFLPVWVGFPPRVALDSSCGVLVRVRSLTDVRHLRRLVRRCKEYLHGQLTAGTYSLADAIALLDRRLSCREIYRSHSLRRRERGAP
jgi:hypothetical protein